MLLLPPIPVIVTHRSCRQQVTAGRYCLGARHLRALCPASAGAAPAAVATCTLKLALLDVRSLPNKTFIVMQQHT